MMKMFDNSPLLLYDAQAFLQRAIYSSHEEEEVKLIEHGNKLQINEILSDGNVNMTHVSNILNP